MIVLNNPSLTSFSGLDNIEWVGYSISIIYNDSLTDFSGLGKLDSIGSFLSIQQNDGISSLDGLNQLRFIGADLFIADNPGLESLSGIENMDTITGPLTLKNNPALSVCGVESICHYLLNNGISTITENATECSTKEKVLESCLNPVSETKNLPELIVYPNPFTESVRIDGVSTGCTFKILDNLGRLVFSGNLLDGNPVDLPYHLISGVYHLIIYDQGASSHLRLIKQVYK